MIVHDHIIFLSTQAEKILKKNLCFEEATKSNAEMPSLTVVSTTKNDAMFASFAENESL